MKFKVSKASIWSDEVSPCEGAIRSIVERKNVSGKSFNVKKWEIEINSIQELLEFVEKNEGSIILDSKDLVFEDQPSITIYDDYVE